MNRYKPRLVMTRSICLALLLAGPVAKTLRAQDMTLELDPANTRIKFTVEATLHTVHGTFALKSGTIHFNPSTGAVSGLVVVDATSGDSGNQGRDRKMHREVLESRRYPEITFTPTKVSGRVEIPGDSSAQVEGIFRLHGADHPMTLTVPVQVKGNHLNATTHIVIPYIDWGLKNPSTLFLHVSDKVEVDISAVGRMLPVPSQPADDHRQLFIPNRIAAIFRYPAL
jgi:polyisoprenoid-binding protein YceI